MAAVSLLQALALIGLFLAGFLIYRRVMQVIGGIEERQWRRRSPASTPSSTTSRA